MTEHSKETQEKLNEAESEYRKEVADIACERLIDARELEKARNELDDKIDKLIENED